MVRAVGLARVEVCWGMGAAGARHRVDGGAGGVVRVLGGAEPEGADERAVWGFEGRVERQQRRIVALRLGRRSGKTTIAAAFALWRAMTADLKECGGGAQIVIPIVAPAEPQTRLALDMAIHLANGSTFRDCIRKAAHTDSHGGKLARERAAVTTRSMFLVRPQDGREVEIRAVVASAGGKNLVGFHVPAMIIDECERMRGESEAKVTDKEQIDAAIPALLSGGAIVMISTPKDIDSFMHAHVERNWGHPVDGLAAVGKTRDMRPDSAELLERIGDEMLRDPTIAMRDYECIPIGREDAYFENLIVDARTVEQATSRKERVTCAVDLAFVRDGCALVVLERHGDRLVQVREEFVQPTVHAPLQPSVIRDRFAGILLGHNGYHCAADVHEFASLCESFLPKGIQVTHAPTAQQLVTAFAMTRDFLRDGKLDVLSHTARQLKSVRTNGRGEPEVPRRPGEGHADLVSALVAAVWLDRRHGPLGAGAAAKPGTLRGSYVS